MLWPELVLVGRNEAKLRDVADRHGLTDCTTDLDAALARDDVQIYFDAQVTSEREKAIGLADRGRQAHLHREADLDHADGAIELARAADAAGVKHGVVQDKLFLPGLRKLQRLIEGGFFGRILSVRGEFGYWVFEGDWQTAQRPSWNYRPSRRRRHRRRHVPALALRAGADLRAGARGHRARRPRTSPSAWDENGEPYEATADDSAYGIFELDGGIVAQINSSWAVRVNRDELVEFQVDGTEGSAVAGLRGCRIQHRAATPKPVWNPDLPVTEPFRASGRRSGQRGVRQRLQGAVGDVPAARRRGRPVHLGPVGRRPRRAARRAGPAVGARGPPHRDAGAGR